MTDDKMALAARVVIAYLSNNVLSASDIPALIASTYAALVDAVQPMPSPAETLSPAVSVKKSVTPEALICLECGKHQKMLKRHLHTAHHLSVEEYRAKWSLPTTYPMVAEAYAEKRSQLAIDHGLGRKKIAETNTVPEAVGEKGGEPQGGYKYPPSRWSKSSE